MLSTLRRWAARWFAPKTPAITTQAGGELVDAPAIPAFLLVHPEEPVTAHPVPYDENLLERARTQWHRGEWENLVGLEMDHIEHHPDRAKLGLVVASAWLQQGDNLSARRYLRHALDWGCDKKLAAQILVAGVHNTLGRTAAILGDETRMDRHFRASIAGSSSPKDRASLSRRHLELHRLGIEKIAMPPPTPKADEAPITYPPHGITSYAQNFEDVMLWRALWNVGNGFYIDVGAWDPVIDSVSKAFYEHGWHGVHVEPLPEYADKIRQDRPDETVYQVLLGAAPGEKTFYYIPETGLSTASTEFVERHRKSGWTFEERKYPVMTLAQVFEEIGEREIHWLKIDVEGMEDAVLAGWGDNLARPTIVLLESTEPNSRIPTWIEWQYRLEQRDYRFVYFDGLNRFYLHKNANKIISQFYNPPNVFDKFSLHKMH